MSHDNDPLMRPDLTIDEARILLRAEVLIAEAVARGVVLTISQVPTLPLRMGGHTMVADVRLARAGAAP